MRILFLNWRDITNPEAGGAEVFIHEIGKRLSLKGHGVVLLCSSYKGCKKMDRLEGVEIVRKGGKYTVNFFANIYILKNRRNFDVIVDSERIPFLSPIFFKPVVCLVHQVHFKIFDVELKPVLRSIVKMVEYFILKTFYKNCEFIAVSESTKKMLHKKFGINPNKIHIVYNGVNLVCNETVKWKNPPTILYFGRIRQYKKIEDIIRAFYIVKKRINDCRLIIAGKLVDKRYWKNLKKLAEKLKVNVKFVPNVSESKKMQIFSESWIYAITSVEEGWGISVVEANSCGIPAVGYDVPGLKDSIRHGYNGLLVEFGNVEALAQTLIRLLIDEKLRKNLSENALAWAKMYSWDVSTQKFLEVLEKVWSFNRK